VTLRRRKAFYFEQAEATERDDFSKHLAYIQ
jgi:hypothetical protein